MFLADSRVDSCKGLVVWDRGDGIVRFAHHTVQQFLLSSPTGKQESNLRCNNIVAELYVGEMCLTYLLFSDFETQIQVRPTQAHKGKASDVPQAGPAYWIPEMLGVRTSKLDLPLQLLGLGSSSSTANIDYAGYLRSKPRVKDAGPSTEIVDKYSLLQYIVDNWVLHTKEFGPPTSSWSRKLQDLAMYKTLPFEFRPWGGNRHYGSYGCVSCKPGGTSSSEAERLPFMSLLHYATEVGHWAMTKPLIEEYCSHEADNYKRVDFDWDKRSDCWLLREPLLDKYRFSARSNDQTVLIAIGKNNLTLVQHITQYYHRTSPPAFVTLINTAASCGHVPVLQYLLDYLREKYDYNEIEIYTLYIKQYAHTTLALLAANGLYAEVEHLWRECVSLNKRVDQLGETPLSAAAANGHDHVVRFLIDDVIDNGALLSGSGVTALHRAAENGHASVAGTLLELPQSRWEFNYSNKTSRCHILGALDHQGETPLHKAARNGHADVVQVMIEVSKHPPVGLKEWILARTPASSSEQTALHLAAANGHLAVVQLLRGYGSLQDINGETPLMLAAKGNHVPVVEILAEVDDRIWTSGGIALDEAIIRGHKEVAQILMGHYAGIVTVDNLVLAASYGHQGILVALIEAHKGGGMSVYSDTTTRILHRAFKQAQKKELDEAAQLLERYWKQET
ncbi:MAG: hypothetical protein Q9221_006405 [Calogaya cf. arnoldii]